MTRVQKNKNCLRDQAIGISYLITATKPSTMAYNDSISTILINSALTS
ncbi:hypothetical protein ABIB50_000892 [Mucilaginibacter sp. UYCu711]